MENNPVFKAQELPKPSFFQKLFGSSNPQNAFIEINNLLASASAPTQVTLDNLQGIASKYKIKNLTKELSSSFEKLYSTYFTHCLKDRNLTDEELNELRHLKSLFSINDTVINKIHNSTTTVIYEESVNQAISDTNLSHDEKDFLKKLEKDLKLPENIAQDIYNKNSIEIYEKALKNKVADQRLSPDDENELKAISRNLGVSISYEYTTKVMLDKFRLFWLIENGQLPEIPSDITLHKTEKAYFKTAAELYEKRTVTTRVKYGGLTSRIKIMKGLYWTMGDVGVQRVTKDITQKQDSGTLYLTSKRIIFMGERKNTNLALNKILDFTPYSDGIEIDKESGRSPIYLFQNNVDVFCMLLSRAISNL